MSDLDTPRLMVEEWVLLDDGTYSLSDRRHPDERDLSLVLAWLRQQGAGEIVEADLNDGESVPSIPVTHSGPFLVVDFDALEVEGDE